MTNSRPIRILAALSAAALIFGTGYLVASRSNRTPDDSTAVLNRLNERLIRMEAGTGRKAPSDIARAVLLPSVQVSAKGGPAGSGTIIYSRPGRGTYVLTAYHVVERAVRRNPVRVTVYPPDGTSPEAVDGDLAAWNEKKDLALVRLKSSRPFPAAALATPERLAGVGLFTPVYAVGCALGHDPLPTAGEITALHKDVQNERFWMMSAPTIWGNSGGGVFHRETMELLGVSTMVCTFDGPSARPGAGASSTPVPHLGILMPLESVTAWLDSRGYRFLFDPLTDAGAAATARR